MTKRMTSAFVGMAMLMLPGLCSAYTMKFDASGFPNGIGLVNDIVPGCNAAGIGPISQYLRTEFQQGSELIGLYYTVAIDGMKDGEDDLITISEAVDGNGNQFRSQASARMYGGFGFFGSFCEPCNLPIGKYQFKVTVSGANGPTISRSLPFSIVSSGVSLPKALRCEEAVKAGLLTISTGSTRPWFGREGHSLDFRNYGEAGFHFSPTALSGSVGKGQKSTLTVTARKPICLAYAASRNIYYPEDSFKVIARSSSQSKVIATIDKASGGQELYDEIMRNRGCSIEDVAEVGSAYLGLSDGPNKLDFVYQRGNGALELMTEFHAAQVYALYPIALYKVKFDCQGGTKLDPVWVMENERYDILDSDLRQKFPESGPTPPKVSGKTYKFEGWYFGSTKVTGSSIVAKGRGNHTLVAKWKITSAKVDDDDNHKDGDPEPKPPKTTKKKPDLVISGTYSPTLIRKSQVAKITIKVSNVGKAKAGASKALVKIGKTYLFSKKIPALKAGKSCKYSFEVKGSTLGVGVHKVVATADASNLVKESNEKNNKTTLGNLEVVNDPPKIDFQFKRPKSSSPDKAWLSTSLKSKKAVTKFNAGAKIYLQYGFWNAKRRTVKGKIVTKATLKRSDGLKMGSKSWTVNGLKKNVVASLADDDRKPSLLQNLPAGKYVLQLDLDAKKSFTETNESNNRKKISFEVKAKKGSTKRLYMVVDLSGGQKATKFPVTYLDKVPSGGWTKEYKTTKLVLRRIEAGSFVMGDKNDSSSVTPHQVTLTKGFYAGVFEVTQRQWELVVGPKNWYSSGSMKPADNITYVDIRGRYAGSGWPTSSEVDADSFMGILRRKTGLTSFDLPTEAQWEYSCRAGTTTDLNSGHDLVNPDGNDKYMNKVGRYRDNRGGGSYAASVGSYQPNAWGLYDMHGNVWEWCLDWAESSLQRSSKAQTDPVGALSGTSRIIRGGNYFNSADSARSSYRLTSNPERGSWAGTGFRVFCTDK